MNVIVKYNSLPLSIQIFFWYEVILGIFVVYHEKHLPILIIIALVLGTLLVSFLLAVLSSYLLAISLKYSYSLLMEIPFFLSTLLILSYLGLLENRGGRIFVFFVFFLFILFRQSKTEVYYKSVLFGVLVFINCLLSFQFLSQSEIFLFHSLFRDKYGSVDDENLTWKFNEENQNMRNDKIPMEFTIPKGLYFHSPETLKFSEKTGSGQIAGILSSSSTDPNTYPYIRIFIIGGYQRIEKEKIKEEYEQILRFEAERGEIDSIEILSGDGSDTKIDWEGEFWSIFDLQRPHYCKTGFYLINKLNGNYILLDIRENLIQSTLHETQIQDFLESFK